LLVTNSRYDITVVVTTKTITTFHIVFIVHTVYSSHFYLHSVKVGEPTIEILILSQDGCTKTALKLVFVQVKFLQVAVLISEWLGALSARLV
jgi:hypothetical protein